MVCLKGINCRERLHGDQDRNQFYKMAFTLLGVWVNSFSLSFAF